MATATTGATVRTAGNALILLLGVAVFLNYVDRGAIAVAAPVMKGELGLSATDFGLAVSAFFWVYAPVQLFAGWLCDRFSVYKLIAAGILLWAASTLLMGLVGGFVSLLVLRIMLGIGESIAFPGASKIVARHVPAERRGVANAALAMGIALGPALGTLAGGLIVASWGWRTMFFLFGLATLLWLIPWQPLVRNLPAQVANMDERRVPARVLLSQWPLWSISIVHALGNYCFYFLLAWLPLYLTKSRGFTITEMTYLASLGYAVQGACAFGYGHFSDWWTRSGRSEAACRKWMMVLSQLLAAGAILGLAYADTAFEIGILLSFAGAATAALSMNLYAIAQMYAGPRASGSWVGIQNALGNLSGIVGPVVTGIIVDRAGYTSAFLLTAAIAAVGALWWAFLLPEIREIDWDARRG
ncbi:MFS transporter [Sphingomonas alba]|uniref:MFS transporter n=1 Tax=Sphingomonas alba TaxID=2908208 RepID=A0ABT0RL13_9SPHN|nr:MFS transporter [Sphingomonas alba]MCL6683342.1 MFS transporter [Sphingomonas alba]